MLPEVVYTNRQQKVAVERFAENWTVDQIEIVRLEWPKEGKGRLSAAQIGSLVKKSRNAVIGKAHRLGLVRSKEVLTAGLRPLRLPKLKRPKVSVITDQITEDPMAIRGRAPRPVPTNIPLAGKPPITIDELRYNTCRAVVGHGDDGLAVYCGDLTFGIKSFCEGHCALFYVAPGSYRRG